MPQKNNDGFRSDVKRLIKDLSRPSYITDFYKDIGIDSLIVLSSVFRPDKSYLGSYLAQVLSDKKDLYKNKTVLDLGCGCGLLGIICLLKGAKKVYFSDINPEAVKNSKLNTISLDLNNSSFNRGNLFDGLSKKCKFDVIIFNSPTISGLPSDMIEAAFIREDNLILEFYKHFPQYLKKGGFVIMPGSTKFDRKAEPINLSKQFDYISYILDKRYGGKDYKYAILIKNQKVKCG